MKNAAYSKPWQKTQRVNLPKQTANSWLVNFRPNPSAKLQLFCFPYAGGNANIFRSWAEALAPEIEVIGIQLPGHGTRIRESLYNRVSPAINALLANIQSFSQTPFALFGHSMGALMAYELSIKLRKRSTPPKKLFVSGSQPPPHQSDAGIHTLNDIEFVKELKGLNGTPKAVFTNQELMDIMLPILRADFAIAETHSREEVVKVPCPITAFNGTEDIQNSKQDMNSWESFTSADFENYTFPGDHFFIQASEALVLDQLRKSLLEAS